MIHSLRKGRASIYFQHQFTGHSISAEKFESEVSDGKAIFRFSLRPVSENQRHDEEYSFTHELISIAINDSLTIRGFIRHVNAQRRDISSWELQILSRGRKLIAAVMPELEQHSALQVLNFHARAGGH
jgi:hypothetical protein